MYYKLPNGNVGYSDKPEEFEILTISEVNEILNDNIIKYKNELENLSEESLMIAKSSIRSDYEMKNSEPITFEGNVFDADSKAVDIMTKVLVTGSVPKGFYWLSIDNVPVPMTFKKLQKLSQEILVRNQKNFDDYVKALNKL